MKATPAQIHAALKECQGCVKRASVILGMARPNLYNRMARLGIRPETYRPAKDDIAEVSRITPGVTSVGSTAPTERRQRGKPVADSSVSSGQRASAARTFAPVSAERGSAATMEAAPEPKALRISRSYYLRPDQVKKIDDACLDLPPVIREKMSPSKVVERFMDDRFDDWVAWLKAGMPAPKRKKGGSE